MFTYRGETETRNHDRIGRHRFRRWVRTLVRLSLLLAAPARAIDVTYAWEPSTGPVTGYLVARAMYPCEDWWVISGVFEPRAVIRDADLWDPFCIMVFAFDANFEVSPASEPSDLYGTPPEPFVPIPPHTPVPEPARLLMLLAGISFLMVLGIWRKPKETT